MTRAQLVLVELAGAAVCGGLYFKDRWSPWFVIGCAVAVIVLALAIVPFRGRWLYQLSLASVGFVLRRRRRSGADGLIDFLGHYTVESVPGGVGHSAIGVVRSGTTWCLPLVLGLDGLLNDDPPVPVQMLSDLLQVEDIPLSSIRLLTLTAPARTPAQAPSGPGAPLGPMAARYLLLTLDSHRAADAIAARGGSEAAVHQMLRRCAVHTEELLSAARVSVRRITESGVESLFGTWLGPASPSGHRAQAALESWSAVRVGGTWSTVFAVAGEGDDVTDRVSRLAAAAPTPLVATVLLLRPAEGDVPRATMLVRLSSPESTAPADAAASLTLLAQAYDLTVERLGGEQGAFLRATTPVGAGELV